MSQAKIKQTKHMKQKRQKNPTNQNKKGLLKSKSSL